MEGLREDYEHTFNLQIDELPCLEFLQQLSDNQVRVTLTAVWSHLRQRFVCNLLVPTVTPADYPWAEGLHGWIVQMPGSAERYCHLRLRSTQAEFIASERRRELLQTTSQWGFYWEGFYDRLWVALREAILSLAESQQRLTHDLVRSRLQRAINQLLSGTHTEEDEEEFNGLPLTDAAKILRQKYEIEIGYPRAQDLFLKEQLKQRMLQFVDGWCDIIHTGKNQVGKHVMRIRPGAPLSAITGKGLPDMAACLNAFAVHANPTRIYRENRGIVDCLDFVQPLTPPLRLQGYQLPPAFAQKVTVVHVAFLNLIGENVYQAGPAEAAEYGIEEGTLLCLDKMLVTPTGRTKLEAYQRKGELLSEEKWLERKERLEQLPGFKSDHLQEFIDILPDNAAVYKRSYRYEYTKPLRFRYDKMKLLYGGLKAVGMPFCQYYAWIKGELVPLDVIVAEETVLAKGAKDALWAAAGGQAGLEVIDPTWSEAEIVRQIEHGLFERGLPKSGRFPVYRRRPAQRAEIETEVPDYGALGEPADYLPEIDGPGEEWEWVGEAICGPVPAIRAQETEERQSSTRAGIAVNIHARNCVGIPFPHSDEVQERLAELGTFHALCSSPEG
jgi:hypothetical protein